MSQGGRQIPAFTPAYEGDDTLVYARPTYNRDPAYWIVFVRKVITIDLREIKGIPNTAKVVKKIVKSTVACARGD